MRPGAVARVSTPVLRQSNRESPVGLSLGQRFHLCLRDPTGNLEAQLFQMGCQIHRLDRDVFRWIEHRRCEVEDPFDPAAAQEIGHLLGCLRRHGHDRQPDLVATDNPGKVPNVVNRRLTDPPAGLELRNVERRDKLETLLTKALIAHQGPSEIAGPDDNHRPRSIRAQDATKLLDQRIGSVAHPGASELPEIGQILADLRGSSVESLSQFARGDFLHALADEILKLSQVQAQPTNGRIWCGLRTHACSPAGYIA